MATDTARIQLELASGRGGNTAPFYQAARRRRDRPTEPDTASVEIGSAQFTHTIVDVPLAAATSPIHGGVADPLMRQEQRGPTPWIAFAVAILSVSFAVWWVMSQRVPDIDPGDVIARNLNDARTAMADGRYTDPPERSAFHYFSTALAIDPANAEAIAGIDAIADRHLTDARLLLSQGRVAEAGVALEKARRVRPDHDGLAVLDVQWRATLRQMLAAATAVPEANSDVIEEPTVKKTAPVHSTPKSPTSAAVETSPPVRVADVTAVTAALASGPLSTSLQVQEVPTPDSRALAVEEDADVRPPSPATVANAPTTAQPRLIKMVQPRYPQEALMRGLDGWVDVSLRVTASGDVIEPRIEDSSRGRLFNKAALAAVEQWKYEARGDEGVSDRIRVRLSFQRSH